MTKGIDWTSEMVFELQRLLDLRENLSFNVIAKKMSETFGVHFTRNSTVGKAHRMRLPPRPPRDRITSENTRPRMIIWSRPARLPRPSRHHHPKGLQLVELERGDCRWPDGTQAPYTFCGKPSIGDGAPYCAMHAEMSYVKPKKDWA